MVRLTSAVNSNMQLFLILGWYCITYSKASLLPPVASIPHANRLAAAPPPPAVGESVDSWLDQLFGSTDNVNSNSTNTTHPIQPNVHPRGDAKYTGVYRQYNGIHELSWQNETTKTAFNLTMDVSKSCSGLNLSSEVGIYTFSNGTTAARTQLKDVISDVWSLAPTPADRRRRWANHTAVVAQLALDEAEEVLKSAASCQNKTAMQVMAEAASGNSDLSPIHDELRHLLSASAWSYWTATIISTVIGAAIGAGLAAGVQHHFTGNITQQNVVQTAVVVGATVLIGGILMRLHENGRLDSLAEAATYQTKMGREAVLQNAHIARWRDAFAEIRRQSTDRAWDGAGSRGVEGFSIDGETTPGSLAGLSTLGGLTPLRTPRRTSGQFMCLDDREAVYALRALGEMTSAEVRQKMMEAIYEYQMERVENGEAGPSSERDWSVCPPLESIGASPLESAEPSFKTAKGGAAEASAADLVEMGNMVSSNGNGGDSQLPNGVAGGHHAENGGSAGNESSGEGEGSAGSESSGEGGAGPVDVKGKGENDRW